MTNAPRAMDFETAVAAVRSYVAREEGRLARATSARKAALRARLPVVCRALRDAGALRVWVFGSMAERPGWGAAHPDSDLDVAVEGLSTDALFEIERTIRGGFEEAIDVVRIEDAPPSLRARIMEDGELVS